ncbi:MAG: cell division topological specificity factor MinE, partial [Solimonas sp.]
MDWLKFFRAEPRNTASIAKERLKVVVAHQREGRPGHGPAYLGALREEILSVVRKYVQVPD